METGKAYHFAYGSNMNEERMRERIGCFSSRTSARLSGYRLEFNKVASRNPREGYANLKEDQTSAVEGILYLIDESSLAQLDSFEGFPRHYRREIVDVSLKDRNMVSAVIYVAQPDMIRNGLKPSKEYLRHLLCAKTHLSEEYYEHLKQTKTLD